MSNASIRIKAANVKDVAALSRIIRCAYQEVAERFDLNPENCAKHPSNCTAQWIQRDLDRGATYYMLEMESRPVACAALEPVNDRLCYLERVAVLPEFKQRGLGNRLVVYLLSEAKRLGKKEVGIGIIAQQQELVYWYQRIGFEKGETKRFDHLPFEVLFMTYRIE